MVRRRDWLIDKKIGSVIRMRRVKLGLSQSDLGNALRVAGPHQGDIGGGLHSSRALHPAGGAQ